MKTLIQVKQKHIRQGKKGDSGFCPIGLAIREKLSLGTDRYAIEVDGLFLELNPCNSLLRETSLLPRSVVRFIRKFDKNKSSVKPFNFYVGYENE